MTTIFYNTYPQPTIEHKPHNRQRLLFAAIAIGLAAMVLENLFSLLFDEIKRGLVSFSQSHRALYIVAVAIVAGIGDAVLAFPESFVRSILEAVVIL